jgi:hypothetical protein
MDYQNINLPKEASSETGKLKLLETHLETLVGLSGQHRSKIQNLVSNITDFSNQIKEGVFPKESIGKVRYIIEELLNEIQSGNPLPSLTINVPESIKKELSENKTGDVILTRINSMISNPKYIKDKQLLESLGTTIVISNTSNLRTGGVGKFRTWLRGENGREAYARPRDIGDEIVGVANLIIVPGLLFGSYLLGMKIYKMLMESGDTLNASKTKKVVIAFTAFSVGLITLTLSSTMSSALLGDLTNYRNKKYKIKTQGYAGGYLGGHETYHSMIIWGLSIIILILLLILYLQWQIYCELHPQPGHRILPYRQ